MNEGCEMIRRLKSYLDPERNGLSVSAEIRDFVRELLNIKPCEKQEGSNGA